jgi:hypothetical protein
MKLRFAILCFGLLLSAGNLFGSNEPPKDLIPFLTDIFDPDSRTNMTFVMHNECPLQYTNVISNTNLFTFEEQNLLTQIPLKYKNVTTNSGPAGSILTSLIKTNDNFVALFQYTNSDEQDEITFIKKEWKTVKLRTKSGDGYDAYLDSGDMYGIPYLSFQQIKHDAVNGLAVNFYGEHCEDWMRCVDGKVVSKWLQWGRDENYLLEIKIKAPLDYFKYMSRVKM